MVCRCICRAGVRNARSRGPRRRLARLCVRQQQPQQLLLPCEGHMLRQQPAAPPHQHALVQVVVVVLVLARRRRPLLVVRQLRLHVDKVAAGAATRPAACQWRRQCGRRGEANCDHRAHKRQPAQSTCAARSDQTPCRRQVWLHLPSAGEEYSGWGDQACAAPPPAAAAANNKSSQADARPADVHLM